MKVHTRYQAVSDTESRERGDRLVAWLRDYAGRRINSRLIDERRTVPPYVALDFGNQGLMGIQVEEKYGGLGLRSREVARVLEQAAGIDLGVGTWLLVCLFPGVRPIAGFAGDAFKNEWLPKLATGRVLAGFAQTEPGAGTHFPGMASTAVVQPGGGWRLGGDKVWIGNSSWAGVLTAIAHEVGEGGRRRGLTALAVRVDDPGVVIGRECLSMGMRGVLQGEIGFRDVAIAPEQLLGEREKGLEVAVDSMCWSRFAITATCIGAMKRAAQLMLRFAARRSIATGRLLDHPVARVALGTTVAQVALVESLLARVSTRLDAGEGVSVDLLSVCKVVGSEFLWETADRLVQVLGSRGYDEANLAPQLLRDARVTRIFEGTSEALLAYIGSQALLPASDLHAFLRGELGAGALSEALEQAAKAARARGGDGGRAWHCALAGEAAIAAILAGVAEQDAERCPSPQTERTAAWTRARFETARASAASGGNAERMLVPVAEAEAAIAGYACAIGDVDQRMPGAREEYDPILLREPPA